MDVFFSGFFSGCTVGFACSGLMILVAILSEKFFKKGDKK